MPKKRKNKLITDHIRKEKQLITARLIEISLKVDEYVYQHRPITETDAKHYIEEVISYKTRCSGDERSLQVIEKLTRCMNAIIFEQKEVRDDICNIDNGRSVTDNDFRRNSLSPVYSIPDEDRSQLTQIAVEHARINTESKDVAIIDLANIDDDDVIDNDIAYTGTVRGITPRIHVEVDIHRAVSNLSLREIEEIPNAISSNVEHSQSILNNFVTSNECLNAIPDGLKENDADEVVKTTNVLKSNTNTANTNNIKDILSVTQNSEPTRQIQTNPTLKSTTSIAPKITSIFKDNTGSSTAEPLKIFNSTNNNNESYSQSNDPITATACYQCRETPDSQRQTWYDSDKTRTINNSVFHDTNHNPQSAKIYKDANLPNTFNPNVDIPMKTVEVQYTKVVETAKAKPKNDNLINDNAIINENSITTKKKRAPRKKKVIGDNTKPKNKTAKRTPNNTNKKTSTNLNQKDKNVPIYNKNVENDLSWIENIRYVREIEETEHDSNLIIEESFWDNYCLPGNLNEIDFL